MRYFAPYVPVNISKLAGFWSWRGGDNFPRVVLQTSHFHGLYVHRATIQLSTNERAGILSVMNDALTLVIRISMLVGFSSFRSKRWETIVRDF